MVDVPIAGTVAKQQVVEVWEENADAFNLFLAVDSQWRYAPQGPPTSLDMSSILAAMDIHEIPRDKRKDMLHDLQVIERAAVTEMSKQAKARTKTK